MVAAEVAAATVVETATEDTGKSKFKNCASSFWLCENWHSDNCSNCQK